MSYQISIFRRAQKYLASLPINDYEKIRDSIRKLAINPRTSGCLKLTGREGWRIRIGNYRVIYDINDQLQKITKKITILDFDHRRDIYR